MSEDHVTIEYHDIKGFPGYRVGSDGTVWSCWSHFGPHRKMNKTWKQLKPQRSGKNGYLKVTLCPGKFQHLVHKLVLEAFVGSCPTGMECCHFDGDNTNNALENLRWDTPLSNHADKRRHGHTLIGSKNPLAKLTEAQAVQIREEYTDGNISQKSLANKYGVSACVIGSLLRRRTWKHV
jgi:hypothetical protein